MVRYSVTRGIFKTGDGRQCPVWKTQEKEGVIMSQGFLLGAGFGCGLDGAGLFWYCEWRVDVKALSMVVLGTGTRMHPQRVKPVG